MDLVQTALKIERDRRSLNNSCLERSSCSASCHRSVLAFRCARLFHHWRAEVYRLRIRTDSPEACVRNPILIRGEPAFVLRESRRELTMVERRIKPYSEQIAENERREAQRRATIRNQTFGLLIVAAAILVWWLFHTNPKWIFPPGWWRL